MTFDFVRVVYACFEAGISLFAIHLILPKTSRNDWIRNTILYTVLTVVIYFFLKDGIVNTLILNGLMIIAIIIINRVNVYIGSITVVILYLMTTIGSIISIIYGMYVYKALIDYRFLLTDTHYLRMVLKAVLVIISVYSYKLFSTLFNKKIKVQKANPRIVFFINVLYLLLLILVSTSLINYLHTIYADLLKIESLINLVFLGITLLMVTSIFVLYIINVYLFKRSDYLTVKLSSETDALTGVFNRKAGINYLKERMQNVQLSKSVLTICFIDVNNLKDVNDQYGHKSGDELIKNVAKLIKEGMREGDEVARIGGDEFLLLFDNCSLEHAIRVWDRVIERFEQFNLEADKVYDISVSVGFAEYNDRMNLTHTELIEIADTEMYKNKQRFKRLKGKRRNAKW